MNARKLKKITCFLKKLLNFEKKLLKFEKKIDVEQFIIDIYFDKIKPI